MNAKTAVVLICGAVVVGAAVRCGKSDSITTDTTVITQPVTTTTTVPVGIVLPSGMVCDPTPPPLRYMAVKVWDTSNPNRVILDSHPIVQNVDDYCNRVVGKSGNFCETRMEGDPQRVACDWLAVGKASDTNRWGPTWDMNGSKCAAPGGDSSQCVNGRDNQFQLYAKGDGVNTYEACASPDARVYPDEGSRCGEVTLKLPCAPDSKCQP